MILFPRLLSRRGMSSCRLEISQKRPRSSGLATFNAYSEEFACCSQSTASIRPKSTLTSQQHDFGSKPGFEWTKRKSNHVRNICTVVVEDDGKAISIATECKKINHPVADDNGIVDAPSTRNISWKFNSALLWVNDPMYIHATSGQRIRTLGQFSRDFAIVSAEIICLDGDDQKSFRDDVIEPEVRFSLRNLHPLPPRGSLHSRGGIYSNAGDEWCKSKLNQRRTMVKLKWNYGHESFFDLDWLIENARNNCLGRQTLQTQKDIVSTVSFGNGNFSHPTSKEGLSSRRNTTTRVTKEIAIGNVEKSNSALISTFDYREIIEDEDILFKGMQKIFENGAILVQNAPNVAQQSSTTSLESIVSNLGRRFSGGTLSHGSLYGDVFHVQNKPNAENIAYTNVALPPHQDLTYYESKPFLQLLHCVTNSTESCIDGTPDFREGNSIVGGESVLIDIMAAAEELREVAPDLFDTLSKTEATFLKERHDADMVSPKPHIIIDPTFGQVVEVNWSPPFEGPLQIHPNVAVEDYIRAYQAIEFMVDDSVTTESNNYVSDEGTSTFLSESLESMLRDYAKEYTWEKALQKGEILVFNNQRMLHGRRSFTSSGKVKRHLIGCYTDAMDTLSNYRQLLRGRIEKNGGGYGKRNPGFGCRWM